MPAPQYAQDKPPLKQALDPISSPYMSSINGTLSIAKEVLMGSFQSEHRRSESTRILSDLAPSLMQPKFLNAASTYGPSKSLGKPPSRPNSLLRLPTALPSGLSNVGTKPTSSSLAILEAVDRLQSLSLIEENQGEEGEQPSLIRGFKATIPSSELAKQRRRVIRGDIVDADLGNSKLGLKKLGDRARGLLTNHEENHLEEDELALNRKSKRKKRQRDHNRRISESRRQLEGKLKSEDLVQQADEIQQDKENLHVRQSLIHAEILEVSAKIDVLEDIRRRLETSLLHIQEEDLELDDELEGVQELMASPAVKSAAGTRALPASASAAITKKSSRRRKGPAFLPSEHDELPAGVAFMTLNGHTAPITALDFNEPYGMLVTAGQDDIVKVWDLCDGEEIGQLRGHTGTVKALQVEDTLCLTGGSDGAIRLWDLRMVEDYEERLQSQLDELARQDPLERIANQRHFDTLREGDEAHILDESIGEEKGEFDWDEGPSGITQASQFDISSPCVRTLEGHSKSVTALYYEDGCLVTGSSDKTIRQWDVATGQCVLTMDILWAISNPPPAPTAAPAAPPRLKHRSSTSFGSIHYDDILPSPGASLVGMSGASLLSAVAGNQFAVPTPPYADGSWEMYQDFVGGVQFWGYALASGSGDGGVRMWDMRTGQAHRTLTGHTSPVTCLQFDEMNIVTGSLDKTIRIWDLRMGQSSEIHKFEYPVTALQFDSRKVVACTGENGVEVYNRTTHQHSRLVTNGHIKPAEKMRFIDKYLVSGGRDGAAKVWAM
ncbi:mitochondrial division protein 1 [Kwoniella pini CBS 10737]|uniref:Mitochondrial division protein 1 n=1 Tax=Kwoniella pini CBS 10737 TaxID=1296096 RepID=A0A1B9ICN4_9TREE|nr:mitochondrial division protein 1 [Kwoniella pini CBS 10737]OCF53227.1 mitochondrial division protein 1 [Kwoniella pini CBS 10737]